MPCDVQRRHVAARTLGVACGRATRADIGERIVELLSEVYRFLKDSGVRQSGLNVVLYLDEPDRDLILTEEGVPMEAGVEVAAPFESSSRVRCSATPAGPVAAAVHVGPYDRLSEAHAAVRAWCEEHGHALAGPNWEIYSHWTDDPQQLRTEVVYLLR